MQSVSPGIRKIGRLAAFGLLLSATGCQSVDTAGLFNMGGSDKPAEQKVAIEELRAFCPRVQLRSGSAFFNNYTRDGKDADGNADPTKVIHQASISDVTRACTFGPGTMTLNVAVAGRVVPGPAAKDGPVDLPIHIVAMRGEEVLYSQVHQHAVSITALGGAAQFVFNDPNVTFPTPPDSKVVVFAGFEQEPAKPARSN